MSKVQEIVTEKICDLLEAGTVPWHKPWKTLGRAANLVSKKPYRGINAFLLAVREYDQPWYVTYNQAKNLGGNVKAGEKSTLVVFWKLLDSDKVNADGSKKKIPLLRYFNVFNVQQCEGLDKHIPKVELREHKPIAEAEAVVAKYENGPELSHGGDRACYIPSEDAVHLPSPEMFEDGEAYYSVLFHELAHSTGHKSRLDREGIQSVSFGSETYAREELVAEMGAAFLAAECGFSRVNAPADTAAYIAHWLKALKNDKGLVVKAASEAQKAVDHILAREKAKVEEKDEAENNKEAA